jgi:hypothetical protein
MLALSIVERMLELADRDFLQAVLRGVRLVRLGQSGKLLFVGLDDRRRKFDNDLRGPLLFVHGRS